jgi:thiol:disulfide interchange protein DsbD
MAAGLALAFGLWSYDASRRAAKPFGRAAGLAAAALSLILVVTLMARVGQSALPVQTATTNAADVLPYEAYSADRLAQLRVEEKPVFVNATAAWCITCLVNERLALSREAVARAFTDNGVALLKADWTNRNAEITALLTEYGRQGVPLYLYFPAGKGAAKILPQILTEGAVLAAIQAGT